MKNIALLIILVIAALDVSALVCKGPEKFVSRDTLLCKGTYDMGEGIIITNDNVTLDCGGAILIGNLTGKGIYVRNRHNAVVQNCNIQGYEQGVYVQDSRDGAVIGNRLSSNVVGVYVLNSDTGIISNDFSGNEKDIVNMSFIETGEKKEEVIKQEKKDAAEPSKGAAAAASESIEQVIDRLGVSEGYNRAREIVAMTKKSEYVDGKAKYTITISASEEVVGLKIYEHIPKEVAADASKISSSNAFKIINDDPDIMFDIGYLDKGEQSIVIYEISAPELSKVNPFSIASIERYINPVESKAISVLFAIGLVLIIVNHFIRREIEFREK